MPWDAIHHEVSMSRWIFDAVRSNLIPYNPTGVSEGSSRPAIAAFKRELERARIPATVRLTRGRDIAAACGQLAAAR